MENNIKPKTAIMKRAIEKTKGTSNFYANPFDKALPVKNELVNSYPNLAEPIKKDLFKLKVEDYSDKMKSSKYDINKAGPAPEGRFRNAVYEKKTDQPGKIYTAGRQAKDVLLHEKIHDSFAKKNDAGSPGEVLGMPNFAEKYDLAWDTAKNVHQNDSIGSAMAGIDKRLDRDYTTQGMSARMQPGLSRAMERHSFLGELGGKSIPKELKQFYKDIYK